MEKAPYIVIMAGGIGSRFWPLSRTAMPKQFIDFFGTGRSLLQQTYDRFRRLSPAENIFVVSNLDYQQLIAQQLPELPLANILSEPARRNTAPCIAYANRRIALLDPQATVIVSPADHLVLDPTRFEADLRQCVQFASQHPALLTLGITPSRPETGYGYIQVEDPSLGQGAIQRVKTFTEKPNHEMARLFVESKEFFWNSGMFVWSLPTIERAFDEFLPDVQALFRADLQAYNSPHEQSFVAKTYAACRSISIDYGLMEHARNTYVLCTDFGWSDLGTWGSLHHNSPRDAHNNAFLAQNVVSYDTSNCIVKLPEHKLAVIQGLDDYIVVDSPDVLLVCRKHDEQRLRQFVTDIEMRYGQQFA